MTTYARLVPDNVDADATYKAMLNILVDAADEREHLRYMHRAMLNMLDDFASDKTRLQNTQAATMNILGDFEEAAEALRLANQDLTKLDKLKNEFVAMASHELRTPLTSISGFSRVMLDRWNDLPEQDKYKYIGIIDEQSGRLSRLVEDLLTLSRIENGALSTRTSVSYVSKAIEQIVETLGAEHVQVSCGTEVAVDVDADHLQQILVNLISNAIKHGAAPISINATSAEGFVCIAVCDNGVGVPEQFVPYLFERFAQADHDPSRSADGGEGRGAGLGLSIVHALVTAHRGELWYDPNTPTGSCFTVRLPEATMDDRVSRRLARPANVS